MADEPVARMHADEVAIDVDLVRQLLERQFPRWATLPITRVNSTGTVNAVFRLGADLAVRMPRTARWHDIERESCWLAQLAPRVPLSVPEVLEIGEPELGYPWPWAVCGWLPGTSWELEALDDACVAAEELAHFLRTLHDIDPGSVDCEQHEVNDALAPHTLTIRAGVKRTRDVLDGDAILGAWRDAAAAPGWSGERAVIHSDILAGNVLVDRGQLTAVIDWASVRAGDPARDVAAAWSLFPREARQVFRAALGYDDATWSRARGFALLRVSGVVYYAETNPRFADEARAAVAAAITD